MPTPLANSEAAAASISVEAEPDVHVAASERQAATSVLPTYFLYDPVGLTGMGPNDWLYDDFSPITRSGDVFVLRHRLGYFAVYLSGNDLAIDANGRFTAGTITGFASYVVDDDAQTLHVVATDLTVSATALQAVLNSQVPPSDVYVPPPLQVHNTPISDVLVQSGAVVWAQPTDGHGMEGGRGGDIIVGGDADLLYIFPRNGSNVVYGGSSDATLYGGVSDANSYWYFHTTPLDASVPTGRNIILAEDGNHRIYAGDFATYIDAGTGDNDIFLGDRLGVDFLFTDEGDTVIGGTGHSTVHVGPGIDYIQAGSGGTTVSIAWDEIYLDSGYDVFADFRYGSGDDASSISLPAFLGPEYGAYLRAYGPDAYLYLGNAAGGYQTLIIMGGAPHLSEIAAQTHYDLVGNYAF